jgi:hypothetical protein
MSSLRCHSKRLAWPAFGIQIRSGLSARARRHLAARTKFRWRHKNSAVVARAPVASPRREKRGEIKRRPQGGAGTNYIRSAAGRLRRISFQTETNSAAAVRLKRKCALLRFRASFSGAPTPSDRARQPCLYSRTSKAKSGEAWARAPGTRERESSCAGAIRI